MQIKQLYLRQQEGMKPDLLHKKNLLPFLFKKMSFVSFKNTSTSHTNITLYNKYPGTREKYIWLLYSSKGYRKVWIEWELYFFNVFLLHYFYLELPFMFFLSHLSKRIYITTIEYTASFQPNNNIYEWKVPMCSLCMNV